MELTELKQTMLKTDNQKLISLATKIEQLNSQLSMANDRCNTLHKKAAKEGDLAKYADDLKLKLESLERQLSEKKAQGIIEELQGKVPAMDEVSHLLELPVTADVRCCNGCQQLIRGGEVVGLSFERELMTVL